MSGFLGFDHDYDWGFNWEPPQLDAVKDWLDRNWDRAMEEYFKDGFKMMARGLAELYLNIKPTGFIQPANEDSQSVLDLFSAKMMENGV